MSKIKLEEKDLKFVQHYLEKLGSQQPLTIALEAASFGSRFILEMLLDPIPEQLNQELEAEKNLALFYQDASEKLEIEEAIFRRQIEIIDRLNSPPKTPRSSNPPKPAVPLQKGLLTQYKFRISQKNHDDNWVTDNLINKDQATLLSDYDKKVVSLIVLHETTNYTQSEKQKYESWIKDNATKKELTYQKRVTAIESYQRIKSKMIQLKRAYTSARFKMHSALCENRNPSIVYSDMQLKLLEKLEQFSPVSATASDNQSGDNLLHRALRFGQYHLFEFLIQKSVDPKATNKNSIQAIDEQNVNDDNEDTYLHHLARYGRYDEACKLITHGASCGIPNDERAYAIDLIFNGKTILIDLVEKLSSPKSTPITLSILIQVLRDHCLIKHFLLRNEKQQTIADVIFNFKDNLYKETIATELTKKAFTEIFRSPFQVDINYAIWLYFSNLVASKPNAIKDYFGVNTEKLKLISELQHHLRTAKRMKSDQQLYDFLQKNFRAFPKALQKNLEIYLEKIDALVDTNYACTQNNDIGLFQLTATMDTVTVSLEAYAATKNPSIKTRSLVKVPSKSNHQHSRHNSEGALASPRSPRPDTDLTSPRGRTRFVSDSHTSQNSSSHISKSAPEKDGARHKRLASDPNTLRLKLESYRSKNAETLKKSNPVKLISNHSSPEIPRLDHDNSASSSGHFRQVSNSESLFSHLYTPREYASKGSNTGKPLASDAKAEELQKKPLPTTKSSPEIPRLQDEIIEGTKVFEPTESPRPDYISTSRNQATRSFHRSASTSTVPINLLMQRKTIQEPPKPSMGVEDDDLPYNAKQ